MNVLVTGGAGYIGSATCVALLEAGYTPIVLDDLSNSSAAAIDAVATICGERPKLVIGDVADRALVESLISESKIEAVIHFAGFKAVGESVAKPLDYYGNNVGGALALLAAMERCGTRRLIFSSSATVYGEPGAAPVAETSPRSATSPYGRTKLMIEHVLEDVACADPRWSLSILRYFNPVGAHPSGVMGEDPLGPPNNLMPYIAQVAVGRRAFLPIYGADYPTADGTGVRDYIHVQDLAAGHVASLRTDADRPGLHVYNLGSGQGHSVFELLRAFGRACGKDLPYRVVDRRPGDVPAVWADPSKANRELGWRATKSLDEMCADVWRWQSRNPYGYRDRQR